MNYFQEDTTQRWEVFAESGTWSFRGIVSDFFNGVNSAEEAEAYIQAKAPGKLDKCVVNKL